MQPGGPPLWVGATGREGALRAARFDTHLLPQGPRARRAGPVAGRAAGHRPGPGDYRVGIIRGVFVSDDVERDWAAVAEAPSATAATSTSSLIKAADDNPGAGAARPRKPIPLNNLEWTVGDVEHCVTELTGFMRRTRGDRPGDLGRPARASPPR